MLYFDSSLMAASAEARVDLVSSMVDYMEYAIHLMWPNMRPSSTASGSTFSA
jgi:hypothetical protein